MTYRIKIHYTTGNSFNTDDYEECLEYGWQNLDMAKESLKRIKNHYKFYQDHGEQWTKPKCKLPVGVKWNNEHRMLMLELMTDDGKSYFYSSFWTGYFETLHSATIICDDEDMKFIP